MSSAKETLESLWALMPTDHDVWRNVEPGRPPQARWREIVELLCGAIWHLEQAVEVGPFDAEQYDALRSIDEKPWLSWQESRHATRQETGTAQRSKLAATKVQSMLLADAVLRIAGAWQILEDMGKSGQSPAAKKIGMLNSAIATDGGVKPGTDASVQGLLVLHSVRDTFMHGELSPDQRTGRHRHRNGLYASKAYAPSALFKHCVEASKLMFGLFHAEYRPAA